MILQVQKAIAINAWDIFCNGVFIERYLKKRVAILECDKLKRKYGVH